MTGDHRRHAEVENAIRDLKYGVGRMPSARFAARRRVAGRITWPAGRRGLVWASGVITKTPRITRSARRETQFRLQAIPLDRPTDPTSPQSREKAAYPLAIPRRNSRIALGALCGD